MSRCTGSRRFTSLDACRRRGNHDRAPTDKDACRPDEESSLYRQTLSALATYLGPDHPTTRTVRDGYATMLTELPRP